MGALDTRKIPVRVCFGQIIKMAEIVIEKTTERGEL
jgi:hypothetical protein